MMETPHTEILTVPHVARRRTTLDSHDTIVAATQHGAVGVRAPRHVRHSGPTALVTAPVMADSQEEARAALALLETCPVLGKVAICGVNIVTELDGLLQ